LLRTKILKTVRISDCHRLDGCQSCISYERWLFGCATSRQGVNADQVSSPRVSKGARRWTVRSGRSDQGAKRSVSWRRGRRAEKTGRGKCVVDWKSGLVQWTRQVNGPTLRHPRAQNFLVVHARVPPGCTGQDACRAAGTGVEGGSAVEVRASAKCGIPWEGKQAALLSGRGGATDLESTHRVSGRAVAVHGCTAVELSCCLRRAS
jgi:hypothetical protein